MKKFFNKDNILLISCIVLVLLFVVFILWFNINKPKKEVIKDVYTTTVIDGIEFSNGNIVQEGGLFTYSVDVRNTKSGKYKVKDIKFTFFDDESEIVTLTGVVNEDIGKETQTIYSSVDMDITNYNHIEVKIEK